MPEIGAREPSPLIRMASYEPTSMVDGPGMRFTLFVQGCPHRCPGCHNPQTHLRVGGRMITPRQILALYDQEQELRGITLSGGEPFTQPEGLLPVAEGVHARGGDVITYTGYTIEQLRKHPPGSPVAKLLEETDLLIDGRFVLALRDLTLPFRGSSNQRLIPLNERGEALLALVPEPQ